MSEQALVTEPSASDVIALLKSQQKSQYSTDQALAQVTAGGDYLPYIQLQGSNSKLVKGGKFPMGHFALMKNKTPIDLTASFVAFLLSWRPKAMEYQPSVKSYFNTQSVAFKQCEEGSKQKGSNKGFGPEFLIWLPEHDTLCTYFLGNISGRMESPNLISCLEKGSRKCRINSELVENKRKESWHLAKMYSYDLDIKLPPLELLKEQLDKFNNPPESSEEPSEKDETASSRG